MQATQAISLNQNFDIQKQITFQGTSSITINGTVTNDGANRTLVSSITPGATSQLLTFAGNVFLSEVATTGRTLILAGTGNTTISGAIENFNGAGLPGTFTISNTGVTTLSGTNTYTGGTNVQAGTLLLGSTGAWSSGTALTIGSAGVSAIFDMGGFNATVTSLATAGTAANQTITNNLNAGNGDLGVPSAFTYDGTTSSTFGGAISNGSNGKVALQIGNGSTTGGTLILSGTNTYTGATTINSGNTLQIGAGGTSGSINAATAVTDNGTLTFNRTDVVTIANTITGTGAVIQAGTGTTILTSGSNAGGGSTVTTSVNAGILQFASPGAIPGTGNSVTVNFGGTAAFGFDPTDTPSSGTADLSRIVAGSAGTIALTQNRTAALDFSTATGFKFTALSLGAVGNVTFSGSLTPNETAGGTVPGAAPAITCWAAAAAEP